MFRKRLIAAAIATTCLTTLSICSAEDWPQWRGADRDDISHETQLLQDWPAEGPPRVWLFENCGIGYSGPAIVGDRLYIMGSREGIEQLIVIDVASGKELVAEKVGEEYENGWGNGPRGTPTIDGDNVYVLGAQGVLKCLDAASLDERWSVTMQEFGGKIPTWGYAESPLIVGNKVICTPGGEQGTMVALDKTNGQLLWQTKDITLPAHYSSAVVTERHGKTEIVQLLEKKLVGLDAENGDLLWETPWAGRVAVIPTPIVRGNYTYATSGYGAGCKLVEVDADYNVSVKYENKVMKNHHGGVILLKDHLYGYSDNVGWLCQDFLTGERIWREREALGKGAIGYADGRFYCLSEDEGHVVLIAASPEGWKEHGRFTLAPLSEQRKKKGKIWMHPVICNGKLYLRDQNMLFCFDVKDAKAKVAVK